VLTSSEQFVEAGRRIADVARTVARGNAPSSPLNTTGVRNRRFTVASRAEDYRRLRSRYDCDVNDVVLAVIAGALRNWLLSRGEPVTPTSTVRAMAPMSVYRDLGLDLQTGPGQPISEVAPFLVDLPIGEGNAVVRPRRSRTPPSRTRRPPAWSTRAASSPCPGSRHRRCTPWAIRVATSFSAGCSTCSSPTCPARRRRCTRRHQAAGDLRGAATAGQPGARDRRDSYCGMLYFGINADREAMSDVDVLPSLLRESLDELLEGGSADGLRFGEERPSKLSNEVYEAELFRLQTELVKLQEWVKHTGAHRGDLRGPRRRRQGRHHQAHHRIPQPIAASPRCRRPPIGSRASGTTSATSRTCPPAARSCCSTGPGTTAGVEKVMGFCTRNNIRSCGRPRSSSRC
jgi:hypothetical protein